MSKPSRRSLAKEANRTRAAELFNEVAAYALKFHKADKDQDAELSFDEFRQLFPPSSVERTPETDLRALFDAIDLGEDGRIDQAEFFCFALRFSQKMLAVRLEEA